MFKQPSGLMAQWIEKEVFSFVDYFFAQRLLKDVEHWDSLVLLCYLMASARRGHLSVEMTEESLFPHPSSFTDERQIAEEIASCLKKAIFSCPNFLVHRVEDSSDTSIAKPLYVYRGLWYLHKNWSLETKGLARLKKVARGSLLLKPKGSYSLSSKLNPEQKQAALSALHSPLSLISGGPGTGKTFTASEVVQAFLRSLPERERASARIKIAAPTGKAAFHLEKKIASDLIQGSSIECGTLHSLLGLKSKDSYLTSPRAIFADLFLVDEASMLDAQVFFRLLFSLQEGGRLVLMGDKNQLPPVEAGSMFADLIQSASMPVAELGVCIRTDKQGLIDLAQAIIDLEEQKVLRSEYTSIYNSQDIPSIRDQVWEECKKHFLAAEKQPGAFRVLSAIRKGPLGVESLNEMILYRFLEGKEDSEMFCVPILITKNSESLGLMNGEVGYLWAKVSSFRQNRYTSEDRAHFTTGSFSAVVLPSFEWGYCLSIHKSQGSEYDSVLALIPKGSESFGKEVLYTAVTRAKKHLRLVGEQASIQSLLQRSSLKLSGIPKRLDEEKKKDRKRIGQLKNAAERVGEDV